MLTLQEAFHYHGHPDPRVQSATVRVELPRYETVDNTASQTVGLVATGQSEVAFNQILSYPTYSVIVPLSDIFGIHYGRAISRYYLSTTGSGSRPSISDFSIPFTIDYGTDKTANTQMTAIWSIAGASPIQQSFERATHVTLAAPRHHTTSSASHDSRTTTSGGSPAHAAPAHEPVLTPQHSPETEPVFVATGPMPILTAKMIHAATMLPPSVMEAVVSPDPDDTEINNLADSAVFWLNAEAYNTLQEKLFGSLGVGQTTVLLYLVNQYVDISRSSPHLRSDIMSSDLFDRIVNAFDVSHADDAFTQFQEGFPSLFDFPLEMPEVRFLSLQGSIRIDAPSTFTVTREAFNYYALSSSFSVENTDPDKDPIFHISRYDWKPDFTLAQNVLQFNFEDSYATNSVASPIKVSVAAYDSFEAYSATFDANDPALQRLEIVVALRVPPTVIVPPGAGGPTTNKRIRGQIVSLTKLCSLKGTVIIQAQTEAGTSWQTVSTAVSDKDGNFNMPYPYGVYSAAQALTSLDASSVTTIVTKANLTTKESISSDFLYILLQNVSPPSETKDPDKSDCGCNATVNAGRLPSQDDLIQSDQYTQDVGGTCANLTVPNRTLREFNYTAIVRNTDPDVANYMLHSISTRDDDLQITNVSYQLIPNGKVERTRIDLDTPIRWEDVSEIAQDENLFEAVTVATGHILYYKSEFRADGYSLGNLLYSLPLAPGQKKEIAIFDSSHVFRGMESQALSQTERLAADLLSERDIIDDIGGNIGEQMAGSSDASTWGVSAAAGASGGGMGWGANVGVAGGYAKSSSDAQQNGARNLAGHFSELLRQGVHQNASSYRQQNSTIVTTAQEAQHYQAETTVIANHNHCHAITMMHYEVLRHFAVYQELVDVEECVFIPFPLTKFSMENISKWADVLATRLLPLNANTYLNPATFYGSGPRHPLFPAFDALERVRTNWELVDWPTGRYDAETIIWAQGEFTIRVNMRRPNTRYDMIRSLPLVTQTQSEDTVKSAILGILTGGISLLVSGGGGSESQVRKDISDKFMRLDAGFQSRRPAESMRIIKFDPVTAQNANGFDPVEFFSDAPEDQAAWQAYANLLGYVGSDGVRSMLKYYFKDALISEWDGIWKDKIAPLLYEKLFATIQFQGLNIHDFTPLGRYRGGTMDLTGTFSGTAAKTRAETQFVTMVCVGWMISYLQKLDLDFILTRLRISYSTEHFNGLLYNGSVNNGLLNGATVFCPETAAEKRYPRMDDRWLAQRLITHLNRNLEYYNRVLLYSLDAQRRFMFLDGFHIEVFDGSGNTAGYHSLSSVLKNSPVAMAGNAMVFPVSPGYKVDRSMILKAEEGSITPSLLDVYKPDLPTPPYRISVPSKGVYAESMMGQCDSCEKLKPDSSQDWTKFTTDDPPAIQALAPPVPEITNYQPTTKDFAPPIISIQNAPAAPDPGVGLAGVTELLGKSGVFKDITGLDANQQNAIKTYMANTDAARAAAGMATNIAAQTHNTSNSAQIMGTIQQAQDNGLLTKAEAGQLAKQHIQSQIDGGATQKASIEQQKVAGKTTIADAAVAAVAGNKAVQASTIDDDGNVSSIKVEGGNTSTVNQAKVQPDVPVVVQKAGTPTCWAAAATMLLSWKAGKALAPEVALAPVGEIYVTLWTNGQGLTAAQKDPFIQAAGMIAEPPASYPPSQFIAWMKKYGPLWVTTDSDRSVGGFSPHAKILVQIDGDGNDNGSNTTFTWINPTDGSKKTESFKDFLISYEQMVTDNTGALFTQIVHLADPVKAAGEGFEIEGPWNINDPVHENITLAALISSGIIPSNSKLSSATPETREFLHGVMWNDDPACLLFDDETDDNWNFSSGVEWYAKFKSSTYDKTNIVGRSHNFDLQFLHAMGSVVGEAPDDTLGKLMLWLEVMYKLSIETEVNSVDQIGSVNISRQVNTTMYKLSTFFKSDTVPKDTDTLFTLMTANTKYNKVDITRRAIGSCLHLIQDSYAKGHCRRKLLNPGDLQAGSQTDFQSGKYAQLSAVQNFHTYKGQTDHSEFDGWKAEWTAMDPSKVDTFNQGFGARMAVEKATRMLTFWKAKAAWDDVRNWLESEVFVFATDITPSDNTV